MRTSTSISNAPNLPALGGLVLAITLATTACVGDEVPDEIPKNQLGKADDGTATSQAGEPSTCPFDGGWLAPRATYSRQYTDLDDTVRVIVRGWADVAHLEVFEGPCADPTGTVQVVLGERMASASFGPGPAFCVTASNPFGDFIGFGYEERSVVDIERQSSTAFDLGPEERLPGHHGPLTECTARLGELTSDRQALFADRIEFTYRCVGGSTETIEDVSSPFEIVRLGAGDELHDFGIYNGGFPCPAGKAPIADTCSVIAHPIAYDEPVSCRHIDDLTWIYADFERLDVAAGSRVEAIVPTAVEYRSRSGETIVVDDVVARLGAGAMIGRIADNSIVDTYNFTWFQPDTPMSDELDCVVRYQLVTECEASGDVTWPGLTGSGTVSSGEQHRFETPELPAGRYVFELDGTADADLYARIGEAPTTRRFDCRPWIAGSRETCTVDLDAPATIHLMVRGWSDSSDYALIGRAD